MSLFVSVFIRYRPALPADMSFPLTDIHVLGEFACIMDLTLMSNFNPLLPVSSMVAVLTSLPTIRVTKSLCLGSALLMKNDCMLHTSAAASSLAYISSQCQRCCPEHIPLQPRKHGL